MPDGLRRKVHEIRCNRASHLADHRGGRGRPARLLQQAADLRRYRHRHRHDPGGTAELPRRESQDLLPLRTSLDWPGYAVPVMECAYPVPSAIASGRLRALDSTEALAMPGVL